MSKLVDILSDLVLLKLYLFKSLAAIEAIVDFRFLYFIGFEGEVLVERMFISIVFSGDLVEEVFNFSNTRSKIEFLRYN